MMKVLVRGAMGKVGREVANAISLEPGLELVAGVDIKAGSGSEAVTNLQLVSGTVKVYSDLETALATMLPDVVVDFSKHDDTFMPALHLIIAATCNAVVGTTGISEEELSDIEQLADRHKVGVIVAPNFSLGAVVMMYLSRIVAAKFAAFDHTEIIELHHEMKIDSPSGTAYTTAKEMVEARGDDFIRTESEKETLPGARGAQYRGVSLHSVRLPGLMAHQEVILGTRGQTLRIRHDQISREGFCPGVIMAVKEVTKRKGLIVGLDKLMDL